MLGNDLIGRAAGAHGAIGIGYIGGIIDTPVAIAGKLAAHTAQTVGKHNARCGGIAHVSERYLMVAAEIIERNSSQDKPAQEGKPA